MDWINLLKDIGFLSIIAAAIGFLIQSSIKLFFDKNFQKFKVKADSELEKYRSQVQLESTKNQIRFSKLHEERAQLIKELYLKIDLVEQSIYSFMHLLEKKNIFPSEIKVKESAKKYNDFRIFYRRNKIYFSKKTCMIIEEINRNIYKTVWNEAMESESVSDFLSKKEGEDERRVWIESGRRMREEAKALKTLLENDFREILGVE